MKLLSIALVISFAIFFPGTAVSQSQELLISIDEDELAQVQLENDWFLKDYLYFAKRHRIVRINAAALQSSDPMTISLFPDTKVTAQREQLKKAPASRLRWVGKVVDPDSIEFGLIDEPESVKRALIDPVTELKIGGIFYDVDIATNESFIPKNDWSTKGYSRPADPSRIKQAAYLAVGAFILSPAFDSVYKIQSLNVTPEYHLVFEFDPTREYAQGQIADPVLDAENTARRERHRAHKEAIGERPGKAWYENIKAVESAKRGEKK